MPFAVRHERRTGGVYEAAAYIERGAETAVRKPHAKELVCLEILDPQEHREALRLGGPQAEREAREGHRVGYQSVRLQSAVHEEAEASQAHRLQHIESGGHRDALQRVLRGRAIRGGRRSPRDQYSIWPLSGPQDPQALQVS